MNRTIHIYSRQFSPWFEKKPKSQQLHIAFGMEQITVERTWPAYLFQQNVLYPNLLLLQITLEISEGKEMFTIIGFCPLNSEQRFVVLIGCDHPADKVPANCIEKAEQLRVGYFNR